MDFDVSYIFHGFFLTGFKRGKHGIDIIAETHRKSHPKDIISILIGSNLCLGVC